LRDAAREVVTAWDWVAHTGGDADLTAHGAAIGRLKLALDGETGAGGDGIDRAPL
jgi:hypothetical protein